MGAGDPEGRQLGGWARFWYPGKNKTAWPLWGSWSKDLSLCWAMPGDLQSLLSRGVLAEALLGWPLITLSQGGQEREGKGLAHTYSTQKAVLGTSLSGPAG